MTSTKIVALSGYPGFIRILSSSGADVFRRWLDTQHVPAKAEDTSVSEPVARCWMMNAGHSSCNYLT